jgi:hypothetical protein
MRRAPFMLVGLLFVGTVSANAVELPFHGFLEAAVGSRVVDDAAAEDDLLLEEARFQLDFLRDGDLGSLQLRTDFLYDGIEQDADIEIREANVFVTPFAAIDLKAGRQILTWGTGDLIFLNDLFPKDWQSFLIGRDDEYLKEPADALRITWFGAWVNLDLVWMPIFASDTFISGDRLSFFNPVAGRTWGPKDGEIDTDEPAKTLGNMQYAGRLYGTIAGWETAVYGFRGNYGQPRGVDPATGDFIFPELEAWGASVRGALFGGIGNAEFAWYRSLDDKDGDDPNVVNPEIRALVGFSHELAQDQTVGLQVYLEYPLESPAPGFTERNRWWITLRYTGLFLQQNLILSWFSFYSPNENDAYLRPKISYKLSDEILLTLGGNVFLGADDDTFFGQYQDNTNVYARVRYSF